MAEELGKFEPEFEVQVKIGDQDFQTIATGKLSISVDEDGKLLDVHPAMAEAFRWVAKQLEKDGSKDAESAR